MYIFESAGFYWFNTEEVPKDCAVVLAECLGVALHESKPDLFGPSVEDPLLKSAPIDGMYEGKDGFWRHIWNVAEVVLDQQRWRHFPDSMIRDMTHPRGFMQTILLDKYDGSYSLGFRAANWQRARDGPLRMINDIVCGGYHNISSLFHDYCNIDGEILYQRCFGIPFVDKDRRSSLTSISVQGLPDDIQIFDQQYRGSTVAPKGVHIYEQVLAPPPYWADYVAKLEDTVNKWDLDKVLDTLYGESSDVCKSEKQMFRQHGERLFYPGQEARHPCYYTGLPSMASHKAGFPWWRHSNREFETRTKISWAHDYYARAAASAWDRVDAGIRNLRATRLSAEEDYTVKEFGGFPGGRHYRPRFHSPYDPLNKFRLLYYRDLCWPQRIVEATYDIGGEMFALDAFQPSAIAYQLRRQNSSTWICGNDDLNMQF